MNYNKCGTRKELNSMSPVGRPKSENPKSNKFSIRLDDSTEKRLESYCLQHGISKGEAIRQGIHLLLEKEKE